MNISITISEMLDDDLRQLFLSDEVLLVSGRPMNIWMPDKEVHFDQCPEIIAMPFLPRLVVISYIPTVGHRHFDSVFHGEYPSVTGCNPETGDEYRFGIRDDHGFSVRPISSL